MPGLPQGCAQEAAVPTTGMVTSGVALGIEEHGDTGEWSAETDLTGTRGQGEGWTGLDLAKERLGGCLSSLGLLETSK